MNALLSRANILKGFGWTFFMLSITILTWNDSTVLVHEPSVEDATLLFSQVRLIVFSFSFFAAALLVWTCPDIYRYRTFFWIGLAILLLGSLLILLLGAGQAALVVIGAALIGLCGAILFVFWQREFSFLGAYLSCFILAISSGLGVALFLVVSVLGYFGSPVACGVISCLLSLVFLGIVSKETQALPSAIPKGKALRKFFLRLWKSILCVASFGFVWQIVYSLGLMDPTLTAVLQNSFVVSQLLASLILIIAWARFHDTINIELVFQLLFPIMATGFLCMPFFGLEYQIVFLGLSLLTFGLMSILMQVACIQEYERSHIDPVFIFGVFAGFVYSAMTAGFAVGNTMKGTGQIEFAHLVVLALILVYAFSFIFFMIKFKWKNSEREVSSNEIISGLELACEALAKECSLSPRESEVLLLLAKGRDLPYVSEKLYVSKNTVRTHMKNIYQKLGVHSKQELLDLLEHKTESS